MSGSELLLLVTTTSASPWKGSAPAEHLQAALSSCFAGETAHSSAARGPGNKTENTPSLHWLFKAQFELSDLITKLWSLCRSLQGQAGDALVVMPVQSHRFVCSA